MIIKFFSIKLNFLNYILLYVELSNMLFGILLSFFGLMVLFDAQT